MYLNTLKPAPGSKTKAKRVGRGIGCGKGKTCGKGHKGQKARAGGFHKVGFEGGQIPLQRRIPKSGFRSQKALLRQEVRVGDLVKIKKGVIDLAALKTAQIINANIKYVKVILAGTLDKAITLKGILVTKGARKAIEDAGGKIEA